MNEILNRLEPPRLFGDPLNQLVKFGKPSLNEKHADVKLYTNFLEGEKNAQNSKRYNDQRFVGNVLRINDYNHADIVISDEAKNRVGGISIGSFLLMVPDEIHNNIPFFHLLRVVSTCSVPCDVDKEHTYLEMYQSGNPNLDTLTMNQLQWAGLGAEIVGMFYQGPSNDSDFQFSEDINTILSPHRYKVFSPNKELLNIIINNGVSKKEDRFPIGKLKITECDYPLQNSVNPSDVDVEISPNDIRGKRTALFGKTRLGKSNTVKVIGQSILESTEISRDVGQLIFDINGEYANDNIHDGDSSLKSAYPNRCQVYAMNNIPGTPSKPLSLNFFEQPDSSFSILSGLLREKSMGSHYIESFCSVEIPNLHNIKNLPFNEKIRAIRRIQYLWIAYHIAGFKADEVRLKNLRLSSGTKNGPNGFNPNFNKDIVTTVFDGTDPAPNSLDELTEAMKKLFKHRDSNDHVEKMIGNPDDLALLNFCFPRSGNSGPITLRPFIKYHNSQAGDLVNDIIKELEQSKTVILDMCDMTDDMRKYFGKLICTKIFYHQSLKLKRNNLSGHFINIYFEEAHNLFPKDVKDYSDIYMRLVKESGKLNIGMVYSTQSPSAIAYDLIGQTENIFVGHMSSQIEVDAIGRAHAKFNNFGQSILKGKKVGYMRFITNSNRFVIPVQIKKFEANSIFQDN